MKEQSEVHRTNYAVAKHHREVLHQQLDPQLLQQLELSPHPALNYKHALQSLYRDELEKTLIQQQHSKELSCHPSSLQTPSQQPKHETSRTMANKPQVGCGEEQPMRHPNLVQRQVNQEHSFFRAQEQYQQRRKEEKEATRRAVQQQLLQKERQKVWASQQTALEAHHLKENTLRLQQEDTHARLKDQQARSHWAEDIRRQMEGDRARRQQKSGGQLSLVARHNPITNPIEYHIDNPYLLQRMGHTTNPTNPTNATNATMR